MYRLHAKHKCCTASDFLVFYSVKQSVTFGALLNEELHSRCFHSSCIQATFETSQHGSRTTTAVVA